MSEQERRGWASWPRNVQLFIVFRVFFNARYYYPIYALLFLDLGLSLSQFAGLNALWAAAIVLLEVPSGALADILGRLKLLRMAAFLMVLEMVCLLVPRGEPTLLFWALAANRIFSGAAEALASGADEALAYESLEPQQRDCWADVLELQMRTLNLAMMVAMLVGGAVYAPSLWQHWWSPSAAQNIALRAPVVLTLGHAGLVVLAVMAMRETRAPQSKGWSAISAAFSQTWDTARWLLKKPTVMLVITSTVFFDHLIRQSLVVSSDYLTAIDIPKVYLGVLGAFSALVSSLLAAPVGRLARRLRPSVVFAVLLGWLLINSVGLAHPVRHWSALWVTSMSVLGAAVGFATSLYLNQLTDEKRRATLLSFKGLAINLGFGWISLAYAGWASRLPDDSATAPVVSAFGIYLPYALVMTIPIGLLAWSRRRLGPLGQAGGFIA